MTFRTTFRMTFYSFSLGALLTFLPGAAVAQSVDFVEPKQGDTVPSTFTVRFAVEGMAVAPTGDMTAGTGHHHLLIDTDLPPMTEPIEVPLASTPAQNPGPPASSLVMIP